MSSKNRPARQDKYAKLKVAAIPLLLGLLAYVLLGSSDSESTSTAAASKASVGLPAVALDDSGDDPSIRNASAAPWPEIDREAIAQINPFASYRFEPLPASSPHLVDVPLEERETAELSMAQRVASGKVDYMFESDRRQIVRLDGRLLEPGTALNDHVRVHRIKDRSIILSVDAPPID